MGRLFDKLDAEDKATLNWMLLAQRATPAPEAGLLAAAITEAIGFSEIEAREGNAYVVMPAPLWDQVVARARAAPPPGGTGPGEEDAG